MLIRSHEIRTIDVVSAQAVQGGVTVSDYRELALGQKLDALNMKVEGLQRDLAGLRQDVSRMLRLLEISQGEDTQSKDPLDDQP